MISINTSTILQRHPHAGNEIGHLRAFTISRLSERPTANSGRSCDVQTYLKERSKEVLSGSSYAIVVRLFGPEMSGLRAKAKEIEKVLSSVEGVADLKVESQAELPHVEIRLRPDAALRHGVSAAQVREAASRRLDISCNVRGRDLQSVAEEIEQRVRELPFDTG